MSTRERSIGRKNVDPAQDRLLDVHEAVAVLGLQPSTLYQWAYQRRIPVVKLGRALRFRLSALLRLIEGSERPALADSA
jgi:excisionase family DNA binding protein